MTSNKKRTGLTAVGVLSLTWTRRRYFRLALAVVAVVCSSSIFSAPAKAAVTTMDECTAQGGTCNTLKEACDAGYDKLGTCGKLYKTGCCRKTAAEKVVTPGVQPIMEDLCQKNPDAPECKVGQAQNTAAAAGSPGSPITLVDPLGGMTINGIIGRFIDIFLGMVGAIALLVFVYAGTMYMTGGSSDRIKKAIETMKYAVLGLMIIMFAYVITSFYFNALTSEVPKAAPAKTGALPQVPD